MYIIQNKKRKKYNRITIIFNNIYGNISFNTDHRLVSFIKNLMIIGQENIRVPTAIRITNLGLLQFNITISIND